MKYNPSIIATDTPAPFITATTATNIVAIVILYLVSRDYAIVQLFLFDIVVVLWFTTLLAPLLTSSQLPCRMLHTWMHPHHLSPRNSSWETLAFSSNSLGSKSQVVTSKSLASEPAKKDINRVRRIVRKGSRETKRLNPIKRRRN